MAFAVRAWRDWTRKEMMAQGLTYDAVMALETEEKPTPARMVNRIVYNYLRTMDEKANEDPPDPEPWRTEYGL